MKRSVVLLVVVCMGLVALPALAGEGIGNGIDAWRTAPTGKSFTDFSREPIPSGFFCAGSKAFTGVVRFKGEPIATDTPGALRGIDTVVQRLDDAVFNERGMATTRLQVRALNLVSLAPIRTECGSFNVRATLNGVQPVTRMRIFRDGDGESGHYTAPLALNVKLTFTPADRPGLPLSLVQQVRFPPNNLGSWVSRADKATRVTGRIKIDTDGDGTPDAFVPGTSNFHAGYTLNKYIGDQYAQMDLAMLEEWHTAPTHEHVVGP